MPCGTPDTLVGHLIIHRFQGVMSVFEHFFDYMNRVWASTLPNRLSWAIAAAVVFELLEVLLSRRLRRAFAPVLHRDAYLEATERVRRRKVILGLPLLALRVVLYTFALLIILRYLGFNNSAEVVPVGIALLATATLIFWPSLKDAAAGYFIMYDGLYATGDRVTIGDQNGVVSEVGLRYTRLRGADGREIALANSTIRAVINHTRTAEIEKRAGRV
jgi:moderate conductance mechanosensitive channel